jgi:hypothetical protein
MASAVTRYLLVAAILMGGLLAGQDLDRALVAMPAWREVGPEAWAIFSRHADLGNGLVLYPLLAIGAASLTLGAALSCRLDGSATGTARWSLYVAALLAIAGLAFTLKAAPIMLGIEKNTAPEELRRALAGFHFWGNIRGLCQILAFLATLAASCGLTRQKG